MTDLHKLFFFFFLGVPRAGKRCISGCESRDVGVVGVDARLIVVLTSVASASVGDFETMVQSKTDACFAATADGSWIGLGLSDARHGDGRRRRRRRRRRADSGVIFAEACVS